MVYTFSVVRQEDAQASRAMPLALGNTRLLLGRNNLIGIDVILMSHPCYLIANPDSSLHCKRLIIRVDSRKVKGGVKRK